MSQRDLAERFRRLHYDNGPLVLANAWDAASARVIERAGAHAIGTTSAGISWSLGRRDGEGLRRAEMIDAIRRIVDAVDLPVTADVESGYGTGSAQDVAETVRAVVDAGAVGVNLEDAPGLDGAQLLAPDAHAARIRAAHDAARAAGGDVVINARTDVYLAGVGAPESRFDETLRRAHTYHAAGADCIFVPGVIDEETIGALARAIDAPLNILASKGAPDIATLRSLGVARVSVGSRLMAAMLAATRDAARELHSEGTYGGLDEALAYDEVNGLFAE